MSLFEKLTDYDVRLINHYFRNFGDYCTSTKLSDMEHILRYWSKNKESFYQMFGEKFILEKEIYFEKGYKELEGDMYEVISRENYEFSMAWERAIDKYYGHEDYHWREESTFYKLYNLLFDYRQLIDNVYNKPTFKVCVNDKELTVQTGCKVSKIIGKLSDLFGIDRKLYENLRIAHSMVLNHKRTKGILCLSIHPMDYITMSDNCHDWSSCMCWMDEPGDYRLGTVEMMNSPYCVVAYIKSTDDHNSEMTLYSDEYTWNSKKWRQLIMITPELILGNKQYPYFHDELQGEALTWMRDLANKYPSFGPYMETACELENSCHNYVDGERKIYLNLYFDYMYNDIYDSRLGFFHKTYNEESYELNLSGPAICINCGKVITYGSVDAHSVSCSECSGVFRCSHCDEYTEGEEYWVDGMRICQYCFENETYTCDICGEVHFNNHITRLYLATPFPSDFNARYSVYVCEDCMNNELEKEFGELITKKDFWGYDTYYINVRNLTEDNVKYLGVSKECQKYLLKVKDAKDAEEVDAHLAENIIKTLIIFEKLN